MTKTPTPKTSPILVRKYGGSSLASVERIRAVAQAVATKHGEGMQLVVVVSAMGRTTDELDHLAHEVSKQPARRELDMLLSVGERITMSLLSMALADLDVPAISLTGSQCGLITDGSHTDARILEVKGDRVREALDAAKVVVVAGFQGVSRNREITTLGRGGSDATAVALAAFLGAERCEILKDVDGVFTADPHLVAAAERHEVLSYDEMVAIAGAGCGVVHARAVHAAKDKNVPLFVGSSFHDVPGTLIQDVARPPAEECSGDPATWRPLSLIRTEDVAILEISGFTHLSPEEQSRLTAGVGALSCLTEWTRGDADGLRWGVIGSARDVAPLRDLIPVTAGDEGRLLFRRGLDCLSLAGPPPVSWLAVRQRLEAVLADAGIEPVHVLAVDGTLRLLVATDQAAGLMEPLHGAFRGQDSG